MDLKMRFNQALEIVKLNRLTMSTVSTDGEALVPGLIFIAAASFIGWLPNGIGSAIAGIIVGPIACFIGVAILWMLAKLFKGQGDYMSLFRPISFAGILMAAGLANIVPFLGWLIWFAALVYMAVVTVVILEVTQRLSRGAAIAVVIIPSAVLLLLFLILLMVGGLALLGMAAATPAIAPTPIP